MDYVLLMIIIVIGIIIYPRRNTFFDKIKLKASLKGFEFEISAKEKSVPPCKREHSNRNK
ncbi:hypothetical protein PBV87_09545 [Niameybacter massiliensis]|uniref:Uncharacterized protein n=1 Tax=Holtiella tumoricola TaxID=3018743 RepID=A0AA42J0T6_9FIRM|nr:MULTISPECIES: hypothetical protein [Lachnospirales]MDA3731720.1 hypothetical protein [Holtiella tumoricola]